MVRCRLNSERESETHVTTMEINAGLQALLDLAYPGRTPRQQASQARADLIHLYRERLAEGPPCVTVVDEEPAEPEHPKQIADRIASHAGFVDDGNWNRIADSVQECIDAGKWDAAAEERLLVEMNKEFVKAVNPYSVQHSRIVHFFRRHLR